ncbi:malonyl-CoA decarboxylase domain-containing protein [Rhodovulum sp. DZ06]|uniref:malonyl-CoA decarboxylase domain-containing protein n=1 Tax=Rhodovulum sp. DZ06 TaxID=3425126 RepID=UPI003D32BC87
MSLFADLLTTVFERRWRPGAAPDADDRSAEELAEAVVGAKAEGRGLAAARGILERYAGWEDARKLAFFRYMAGEMTLSPEALREALAAYEAGQSRASYGAVMAAAEPRRQELIRRLNQAPGATRALVEMRADLLRLGRGEDALMALDLDFQHLFRSWFNRGFLVLRPINWESPAHILEKIIAYEAVHDIGGWDDLRRRLQPSDRRCFAFFHPAMPDEPLIFVEVALTRGVPGSIQALLADERAAIRAGEADAAAFYSISNCQAGLAGISFGNSLIKQVAADLAMELPGLETFVTLSPIPGFGKWLAGTGLSPEGDDAVRALAAHYIAEAKRDGGAPLDPVARFHLGNGAAVHAVHAGADTSDKGLAQSRGAMVNYIYDLPKVAERQDRFAAAQEVAVSDEVKALCADAKPMLEEAKA